MKFKIGDKVKIVSKGISASGRLYNGKIGTILERKSHDGREFYYSLDIDVRKGGIWEQELVLVDKASLDLSYIKPYGIVKFLNSLEHI
jgi:hypothetical protein